METPTTEPKRQRTILVVDDDPTMRRLLKLGLGGHGFKVITGINGHQAIKYAMQHDPDLLLLDVMMPELGGLEACRIIKKNKADRFLPIIFLTSRDTKEDMIEALDKGGDDYLVKPFFLAEVLARIRSLLRVKDLTEQLASTQEELIQAKQVAAIAAAAVTVNHRINNPLTTIMINASSLEKKMSPDEVAKYGKQLQIILEASRQVGDLTKKLSKLSKLQFVDYVPGTVMLAIDDDDAES